MEELKIVVLGEVQSQLRPIMSTAGYGKKVTAIDPPKCRAYKKKVKGTAIKYVGKSFEPLDEPLRVDIKVYMGVTKSWTKKKKEQALSGEMMPTYKKDIDNMVKPLLDGCTGIVWKDDGCIVELSATKEYSEVPRAEITINTLDKLKSN